MNKITVIIPVYNTREFLYDCFKSIIEQTYQNLEVLVINDGSNEECKQMIDDFAMRDERVTCYHFDKKNGVGAARNFGIDKATGDYIYFLDSDDFIADNTLELLIDNINDQPMITGKIKNVSKTPEITQHNNKKNLIVYEEEKSKVFENKSVLHRLISTQFIKKNNLRFSESVACFSDLEFLLSAMLHMDEALYLDHCLYFHRQRNDPISNPSLSQSGEDRKIQNFLYMYAALKDAHPKNKEANSYLDKCFLNFYRKDIVKYLERVENVGNIFTELTLSAQKLCSKIIASIPYVVKREMKALRKTDEKKFSRYMKTHQRLRKLKKALNSKKDLYIQLYQTVFLKLPLKEKTIVFESFLGKNYSDNPKYIYEYMLENKLPFKYVWIFDERQQNVPGNHKQVKRFSLSYYYYLARAKYWVSNSRMPKHLDKREGNIYLQTWHGTPLKKLVFDMDDVHSANPKYKQDFYQQSRRWDYLISPNQYSSEIFRRAFKYDKQMLEYGYPRNDILYTQNNKRFIETIKQKLNIPLDKKVILYAPTWRDDEFYARGKYKFNLRLNLSKMMEQLGNDYVIILRMHYFIADNLDISGFENFAYDLSKYDDVAELYLISDILITDYSSVFFDYANLRKPILFYTYDLEKYQDQLRGFYINIEEDVPGPLLKSTEEVINAINHIDEIQDQYASKYDKFYNKFCMCDNGRASEQVVKHVFGDQEAKNQTLKQKIPLGQDGRDRHQQSV